MATTATEHHAKAESLAEEISTLRKGAPLYLALAAEAQLHATLALVAHVAEKALDDMPKPPAVKAATKRAPKLDAEAVAS